MKKSILALITASVITLFSGSVLMADTLNKPADLEDPITEMESRLSELEARIARLEARLMELEAQPAEPEALPAETGTEKEEDKSFPHDIVDGTKIVTAYYSITVPESWRGAFTVISKRTINGLWMDLFSKEIYESEGYGHLFSIFLTEDEKYKDIADYELLGDLTDQEGTLHHVVAVFPTDVQYPRESKDSYSALSAEAENILGTFEAADGCVFVKEKTE